MDVCSRDEMATPHVSGRPIEINEPLYRFGRLPRTVLVLAFDNITLSDVAGPTDVFDLVRQVVSETELEIGANPYRVIVGSVHGGFVRSASGLLLATAPLTDIDCTRVDTLIVPGGGPPGNPPVPAEVVAWLATEGRKVRRICSVCTGAFLIAEAGLADGRRVTTHWMAASTFAERYPDIIVDSDPIFIKDGAIWSSAGFTAGLDLSLALIEEDLGHDIAMRLARALVMFLKRPGGQSQFSAPLASQSVGDSTFDKLHAWIMEHLADDLHVVTLAERAGMTPRTFARRYVAKVGRTPAKTIEIFRLEAACRQIVQTDMPLKKIACENGFGNEQNMRRTFWRHFGVYPQHYRDHFRSQKLDPALIAAE
ncbi:GlxA family transcriptional regulator [Novosphingobium sp.]|uniref:GlxA family transcriptional regulator n=2 Tax=Novosphingobium sp. TaxID=1874826 RepID=UPI002FD8C7E2